MFFIYVCMLFCMLCAVGHIYKNMYIGNVKKQLLIDACANNIY